MAKQTFTTGQVLTAAQMNSLQSNDFNQTVSVKTASYTLVAADKGTRIEFNTSGSVTCTVNSGLFDAGDTLIIQNRGAGAVTVTAGTATVNTEGSLVINQYGLGILYFISDSASILFAGAAGDITGVTAGTGLSGGGSSGSVTLTNTMATEITAAGDIIVGTGSGTFDNLPIGTTGQVLTADTSVSPYKVKWAAAAGGGKVLQVVQSVTTTSTAITATSLTDTGISGTITPTSNTSKILVLIDAYVLVARAGNANIFTGAALLRGATNVYNRSNEAGVGGFIVAGVELSQNFCFMYLDSPATTSATTYKLQFEMEQAGGTATFQRSSNPSSITLMEIGA